MTIYNATSYGLNTVDGTKDNNKKETQPMNVSVEVADQVRRVAMIINHVANNTKDEGLAFILDGCVNDLIRAIHGVDDETSGPDERPGFESFNS
jgi:hypothetical protein